MAEKRINKDSIAPKNVFENLEKGAIAAEKQVKLLENALRATKSAAALIKGGLSSVKTGDTKSLQELNTLTKQANATAKTKLGIDKELLAEKEKLRAANAAQNKSIKEELALANSQKGSLERVRLESKKLRNEKEKLNLTTKEGNTRLKIINRTLDRNNKIIEKNATKLGKQKIAIGRYSNALRGLRTGLAQLGVSMGVFALMRDSFNVIKDFEQAQANLASVLGVNVTEMKALTAQAKELGATTRFTASQVSELQVELAKLGFTQKQIQDMTAATLSLAEATGTELADAASVAGSTLNGFGLAATDTQRVVDVMAKSFSSSSLDMEKFKVAMAAVAPIAKTMGFSLEETTAMIGSLTDAGLDASTAGTSLRNMMLEASKQGLTWKEALDKVNNSTDKAGVALELFGKRGVAAGVILAENQDKVAGLTEKLDESEGAAAKMADTQRNTLGGALDLLRSAWEGLILSMDEAGGVGDTLRKGVVFLADNLGTIVKVLGKVIKAFVIFKTALFAIKMSERIREYSAYRKELKKVGKGAEGATKGVKNFGKALKAIGLSVAISLILELAKSFYDAASGAAELRRQEDLLAKALEVGSKVVENILKTEDKKIKTAKELLELAKANKEINDLEFQQAMKKLEEDKLKRLEDEQQLRQQQIIGINKENNALKAKVKLDQEDFDNYYKSKESREAFRSKLTQIGERIYKNNELIRSNNDLLIYKTETEKALGIAIEGSSDIIHDYNVNIIDNSNVLEFSTKATVKRTKATKDLTDEIMRQAEVERMAREEKEAFDIENMQTGSADELEKQIANTLRTGDVNTKVFKQRLKEEEELRSAIIERQFLEDIDNATSAEDVILATQRRNQGLARLDDEMIQRKLDGIEQLNDAQEQFADKRSAEAQRIADEELATERRRQEELRDLMETFGNEVLDGLVARSKKKQSLLDEEIAKEKELADALRQGAQEGNAVATESLAVLESSIEAKERAKIDEAQKEERIEEIKAIWGALNNFLDNGDSLPEATIKATTGVFGVKKLIEAIPGFFTGTKGRLGDENKAIHGGKDGHLIWADSTEMILNGGQVDDLESAGMTTTDEVIKSAVMFHQMQGINQSNTVYNNTIDTSKLEGKIDNLTQVMKNKPEVSFHPHIIQGLADGIVKKVKRGSITNNHITHSK